MNIPWHFFISNLYNLECLIDITLFSLSLISPSMPANSYEHCFVLRCSLIKIFALSSESKEFVKYRESSCLYVTILPRKILWAWCDKLIQRKPIYRSVSFAWSGLKLRFYPNGQDVASWLNQIFFEKYNYTAQKSISILLWK